MKHNINKTNKNDKLGSLNFLFKIKLFFLISTLLLISCLSSKQMQKALNFEGTFQNLPIGAKNKNVSSMCENIRPFELGDKLKFDTLSSFNLALLNQRTIRITCQNRNGEKRVSDLKYDIYRNTLEIENNKKNQGIPFVFHRYRNVKIQMELDSNGNLDADFDGEVAGGILIMYFGESIKFSAKFKRLY